MAFQLLGSALCRPSFHAPKQGGQSSRAGAGQSHWPQRGWSSGMTQGESEAESGPHARWLPTAGPTG